MAEIDTKYYSKHIAETSPYQALRLLKGWQKDYKDASDFDADVWQKYNDHFKNLYYKNECIHEFDLGSNELAYSEKDFEYHCLAYWQNKYGQIQPFSNGVNSAITDISNAIAIIKMLYWLKEQKPQPQHIEVVQTSQLQAIRGNDQKIPSPHIQESGLNLKSQFTNPDKYDEVINKLVANDNIHKHQSGKLIFIKCHRRGTRYGVEALRLVLQDLEYLKSQSNLTNAQIVEIHKNTYYDFNIDVRTLNQRKSISVAYQYFKKVLS